VRNLTSSPTSSQTRSQYPSQTDCVGLAGFGFSRVQENSYPQFHFAAGAMSYSHIQTNSTAPQQAQLASPRTLTTPSQSRTSGSNSHTTNYPASVRFEWFPQFPQTARFFKCLCIEAGREAVTLSVGFIGKFRSIELWHVVAAVRWGRTVGVLQVVLLVVEFEAWVLWCQVIWVEVLPQTLQSPLRTSWKHFALQLQFLSMRGLRIDQLTQSCV
jgi:hypothetical protein